MNVETMTTGIVAVDYSKSLEAMIAAGRYDRTNEYITAARFPLQGEGVVHYQAKIFQFDRYTSSFAAVAAIKADDRHNPWEPAKIEHLLAYGAAYPEDQRQYPIIGLGSVAGVGGRRYVPYLRRFDAERSLGLSWWGGDWDGGCRFLAVRNLASAT